MEQIKRRRCCPQNVQLVWDAIIFVRAGKQLTIMERIVGQLKKHDMDEDTAVKQVKLAVKDKLVFKIKKIGCKGSKKGIEQTSYHLPLEEMIMDDHDWYCFECQKAGGVLCCKTCFRVYHQNCINQDYILKILSRDKFICPICMVLKSSRMLKLKKEDLNTLLGFTCSRLKEKVFCKPVVKEDRWREKALIYNYVDLNMLEKKIMDKKYRRLEEFDADVQNIAHNMLIYHGANSTPGNMARQMLRDCMFDLKEIEQCHDCYRMSNEKKDKFWFCQPCNPPHELVFAQQKGFPFWPAKVLRHLNDKLYDVRFFGGSHERAYVPKANIKPVTVNPASLGVKSSMLWTRACDELKKHQQILANLNTNDSVDDSLPTVNNRIRKISMSNVNNNSSMINNNNNRIGSPDFKQEAYVDEDFVSDEEPRPKKIDRYVRAMSIWSTPMEDPPGQYEDWTPIRHLGPLRLNSQTSPSDESLMKSQGKPDFAIGEDKDEGSRTIPDEPKPIPAGLQPILDEPKPILDGLKPRRKSTNLKSQVNPCDDKILKTQEKQNIASDGDKNEGPRPKMKMEYLKLLGGQTAEIRLSDVLKNKVGASLKTFEMPCGTSVLLRSPKLDRQLVPKVTRLQVNVSGLGSKYSNSNATPTKRKASNDESLSER